MKSFKDKVAIVTGGEGTGIGNALVNGQAQDVLARLLPTGYTHVLRAVMRQRGITPR